MDVLESDLEKIYVLLTPEVRHKYTNRQTCQSLSVEIQPRLNSTLWPVKTSIKVVPSIFSQQMSTLLLWLFLFVTDVKTTWRRPETIVMCYFGVTSFMQICFPGIVSTPVAQLLSSIPKKGRNFFYVTDTDAASSSQRPASQVWLTQVSY